jgi:hypothetical protein
VAIWQSARAFFSFTPCVFSFSHTLSRSRVYVGGVCERDYYLADCFVRGANKALRLILSARGGGRRPHDAHTLSRKKRIMGGPVLLAQYKCRPLSRRQIKLSGRYVKARAPKECAKSGFEKWRDAKDFLGSLRQFVRCQV